MTSFLPPNSTDLERKIAEVGKDTFDLPSIRIIKDIDNVPSQFLPTQLAELVVLAGVGVGGRRCSLVMRLGCRGHCRACGQSRYGGADQSHSNPHSHSHFHQLRSEIGATLGRMSGFLPMFVRVCICTGGNP